MGARLFVAVTPPAAALDHLDTVVAPMRARHPELRWTKPSMLHLTCAFFGDVAEKRVPELTERLARAASRHRASSLRFAGSGAFSRPSHATVLFAQVVASGGDGPDALATLSALAASCAAAGRRIGLHLDDRPFRPHLTLARAKGRSPVDMRSVVEELAGYEGPSWSASEIVLMRSHLGADAYYEPLASWPLASHQA